MRKYRLEKIQCNAGGNVQALQIAIQALSAGEFSPEKIKSMIPADTMAEIKKKDDKPFFQAYSIAHEGTTRPLRVIGDSVKSISWPRRAVESIKNIILKGVKFFIGHNADNSTEGRRVVGEIVADSQEEIGGKLHHVVIAYHEPGARDTVKNFDICSQESECLLYEENGSVIVNNVEKITGIALASSKEDSPGFPGALRLGAVQAFEKKEEGGQAVDLSQVVFKELIEEVQKRNTKPSQIFTVDDLKKDREFDGIFAVEEKAANLKKELDAKNEEIKKAAEEKAALNKDLTVATAEKRLSKLMDDRKVTERQKSFIVKKAETLEDATDEGLKTFLDKTLEDYKETAELFGVTEETAQAAGETQNTEDPEDYTKAANNPLLDEDLTQ